MRSNQKDSLASFLNLLLFIYSTILHFFPFQFNQIQPYQPRSYISVDRQQRHQSPSSKQYNLSSPSGNYSSTQQQQMSLSLAYTGGGRSNGISNTDMQPDVSDLHQSLLMTNSITRVYQSMGGGGNGGSSYDKVFQWETLMPMMSSIRFSYHMSSLSSDFWTLPTGF